MGRPIPGRCPGLSYFGLSGQTARLSRDCQQATDFSSCYFPVLFVTLIITQSRRGRYKKVKPQMNTDAHRWRLGPSFLSVFIGVHLWLILLSLGNPTQISAL
jgi:hypothetical protein